MPDEIRRVYGPYTEEGSKGTVYRVVFHYANGRRRSKKYGDRPTALRVVDRYDGSKATTVRQAIEDYLTAQRAKGRRESTLATARYRLRVLDPVSQSRVDTLTPNRAEALLEQYREGRSNDTVLNALNQCKAWGRWLVRVGKLRVNPFESINLELRRNRGKPQMRVNEAMWLVEQCIAERSPEATAVVVALVMGMRASEVCNLTVRDFDADGTLLWVEEGKTRSAKRTLQVPELVRELLRVQVEGKRSTDRIFTFSRFALYHHTHRLCREADVPEVSPHALRGMHSTYSVIEGQSPEAVARALGQAGAGVTRAHYIAPGTEQSTAAGKIAAAVLPRSLRVVQGGA